MSGNGTMTSLPQSGESSEQQLTREFISYIDAVTDVVHRKRIDAAAEQCKAILSEVVGAAEVFKSPREIAEALDAMKKTVGDLQLNVKQQLEVAHQELAVDFPRSMLSELKANTTLLATAASKLDDRSTSSAEAIRSSLETVSARSEGAAKAITREAASLTQHVSTIVAEVRSVVSVIEREHKSAVDTLITNLNASEGRVRCAVTDAKTEQLSWIKREMDGRASALENKINAGFSIQANSTLEIVSSIEKLSVALRSQRKWTMAIAFTLWTFALAAIATGAWILKR